MKRIDFNVLISRYIPPHWRATAREKLMQVICDPVKRQMTDGDLGGLYYRLKVFRKSSNALININSQVGFLEYHLENVLGSGAIVDVVDGDFEDSDFKVYLLGVDQAQNFIVRRELDKYKIAGKRYLLINF